VYIQRSTGGYDDAAQIHRELTKTKDLSGKWIPEEVWCCRVVWRSGVATIISLPASSV